MNILQVKNMKKLRIHQIIEKEREIDIEKEIEIEIEIKEQKEKQLLDIGKEILLEQGKKNLILIEGQHMMIKEKEDIVVEDHHMMTKEKELFQAMRKRKKNIMILNMIEEDLQKNLMIKIGQESIEGEQERTRKKVLKKEKMNMKEDQKLLLRRKKKIEEGDQEKKFMFKENLQGKK